MLESRARVLAGYLREVAIGHAVILHPTELKILRLVGRKRVLVQCVHVLGSDRALVREHGHRELVRTEQSRDLVDQTQVAGHRIVRLERHVGKQRFRSDMNCEVVLPLDNSILREGRIGFNIEMFMDSVH